MRKSALYLFGLVAASLVALGLIVLCSASQPNAIKQYGFAFGYFIRQLSFAAVGIVVAGVVARTDYRIWKDRRNLTWALYAAVLVALLVVLTPLGKSVKGSARWIPIGPVNVQPSEFAKLAIVIVVGVWMDGVGWKAERFRHGVLIPIALVLGFVAPILCETDLGSSLVVLGAGVLMMLLGGTKWVYFIGTVALGLVGIGTVARLIPNRVRRLAPWVNEHTPDWFVDLCGFERLPPAAMQKLSEMDPASYQAYNSLVAIKNGGIGGAGLGQSMQKHAYLPEAHTDFVMAVGAEELGVFFSIAVIVLFFLFFALSVYIALKASDRFGRFLALGMGFIIFGQAMVNLGVICEALPTKGMALPFFSYGGTNMIAACIAVGIILSVGIHSYRDKKRTLRHDVNHRA